MSNCQLTRVRLEAIGPDHEKLTLFLIEMASGLRLLDGGLWEIEDPGITVVPSVQPDKSEERFWGRLTIKRSD